MENLFDFKKIGRGCLFCFNADCPRKDECIYYLVSQHIPDGMELGNTVLPPACRNRECRFFKLARIVEFAYGFEHLYDKVLRKDYTQLRLQLTEYLGNKGQYYAYKHGKRGLSPEKQEYIRRLFARYGYEDAVVFDRYVMEYDF